MLRSMNGVPIRTRDAEATRARILAAAQTVFSTRGYAEAGVREITALAAVNPSLVNRYFGSKEGLFEAALEAALNVGYLTDAGHAEFGRRVVDTFLEGRGEVNPLPMLVFAAADAGAKAIALRLLADRIVTPLAGWLGGAEAEARAARIMVIATGFFTFRLLLPLAPLAEELSPGTRDWLAQSLQAIVTPSAT